MWFMRLVYAGVYAVYLKGGHFGACAGVCGSLFGNQCSAGNYAAGYAGSLCGLNRSYAECHVHKVT